MRGSERGRTPAAAMEDVKEAARIRIAMTLVSGLVIPVGIAGRSFEVIAIWPCVLLIFLVGGVPVTIRARRADRRSLSWVPVAAPVVAGLLFGLALLFDRLHERALTFLMVGASPVAVLLLDLWLIRARPSPHPILRHDATRERRGTITLRRLIKTRIAVVLAGCALLPAVGEGLYLGWALTFGSAFLALGAAVIVAGLRSGDRRPALVVLGAPVLVAGLFVALAQAHWRYPGIVGVTERERLALTCLILATVPLADFWLLISPRPGSDGEGAQRRHRALADTIRETVLSHPAYRLRNRVVRGTVATLEILIGFGVPLIVVPLVYMAVAREPSWTIAQVLIVVTLLIGIAFIGALDEWRNGWGYRSTEDADSEIALLGRLTAGAPFGIYLRTFGAPTHDGVIATALRDCPRCPFFALEDVRQEAAHLSIASIWIPDKHWQKVVFPLIEACSIVVVDLSTVAQPRPGLRAELDFIVASKLTTKAIVIASVNSTAMLDSRLVTISAADLPHQLAAMLSRAGLTEPKEDVALPSAAERWPDRRGISRSDA